MATPTPDIPLLAAPPVYDRILRSKEVSHRVSLSRTTIYRWMHAGQFPASVPLGGHTVGWRESDIAAWIASRQAVRP